MPQDLDILEKEAVIETKPKPRRITHMIPHWAEKKNINPIPNLTKVHVLNCLVRVEIYLKMVNDGPEQNQKASLSSILILFILE